jgi:hypothetical protein
MLIIIPVKLVDSNSSIQGTNNSQHNETFFTKSRAITLQILYKSTSETQGAQLHMLSNIPVGQILFELHATQVENCKILLSQGQ